MACGDGSPGLRGHQPWRVAVLLGLLGPQFFSSVNGGQHQNQLVNKPWAAGHPGRAAGRGLG